MHSRLAAVVVAAALIALAWTLPLARHRIIHAATTYDATPGEPAPLPAGEGPGLAPTSKVRVVLIDGLAAETARTLPVWSGLCRRGVTLTVDVGFPTVSLPIQAALWTGLTQQQTGIVFRSDRPFDPPLQGIPSQVPGSIAIAESHGYIVRSLGFSHAEPAADPKDPAKDIEEPQWQAHALDAVHGDARLVFVHLLRVDDAGHKQGRESEEYLSAARAADHILDLLVQGAPDARWFVLSDHGHLAAGGHGGEEPEVRQIQACIAGPGVQVARGDLVHVIDVARAIADSVGAKLAPASRGRPLSVALAAPLAPNQAVPPLALEAGAIAIFVLVLGTALSSWGVRRWVFAPWWFVIACGLLYVLRGEPTLSMPMVYAPTGRTMYLSWLPALALATLTTWYGLGRTTLLRIVVAQIALPLAAVAAALAATGAWHVLIGEHVAPVVPRYTAWLSPLMLMASQGLVAVALGVLGKTGRSVFGPPRPPETAQTET